MSNVRNVGFVFMQFPFIGLALNYRAYDFFKTVFPWEYTCMQSIIFQHAMFIH